MKNHSESGDKTQVSRNEKGGCYYHSVNEVVNTISNQVKIRKNVDFTFSFVAVASIQKLFHGKEDNDSSDYVRKCYQSVSFCDASGSKSRKALLIKVPEEKPTKTIRTRFNVLSFNPANNAPAKDTKLTANTEAKIVTNRYMHLCSIARRLLEHRSYHFSC